MSTALKRMTLEEAVRPLDDGRFEFVNGELLEREMSNRSVRIGGLIYVLLAQFARQSKAGEAQPDGVAYRCFNDDPERVRKPDVSWIASGRWAPALLDTLYIEIAPDLIVEVVSPTDRAANINRKVRQFFAAGSTEAWIVYPEDGQLERRFADGSGRWYSADEEIDAAPLIPGFKWKLADVLANA